jgi:hypothetical protein
MRRPSPSGGRPRHAHRWGWRRPPFDSFPHSALLIAGECDPEVLVDNRQAYAQLKCEEGLGDIPEPTHLFEEPGDVGEVARRPGPLTGSDPSRELSG